MKFFKTFLFILIPASAFAAGGTHVIQGDPSITVGSMTLTTVGEGIKFADGTTQNTAATGGGGGGGGVATFNGAVATAMSTFTVEGAKYNFSNGITTITVLVNGVLASSHTGPNFWSSTQALASLFSLHGSTNVSLSIWNIAKSTNDTDHENFKAWFSTFSVKDGHLSASTQTILVMVSTTGSFAANLSVATNTILNMISSNAVVTAGLTVSTGALLNIISTQGVQIGNLSISSQTLRIAISTVGSFGQDLSASTTSLANRTAVIVTYQNGVLVGDASTLDISGTAVTSFVCSGTTCTLVLTAGAGGGGGGSSGGFLYTGSVNVAFSTISFPLATITSDGQGGSTISYVLHFSTIANKINGLSASTQTLVLMISTTGIQAVNLSNATDTLKIMASTAGALANAVSLATNTLLSIGSTNFAVLRDVHFSTEAGAAFDSVRHTSISVLLDAIAQATTTLSISTNIIINQGSPDISNRTYYLHDETTGTAGLYRVLASSPASGSEVQRTVSVVNTANIVRLSSHITLNDDPGVRKIPAGVWSFTTWASVASLASNSQIVVTVSTTAFDGSGASEFLSSTSPVFNVTDAERFDLVAVQTNDLFISTSHRILLQVFGRTESALAVNMSVFYQGSSKFSHLTTPIGAVYKLTQLADAPSTLIGQRGKFLSVNDEETATVFVSSSSGGVSIDQVTTIVKSTWDFVTAYMSTATTHLACNKYLMAGLIAGGTDFAVWNGTTNVTGLNFDVTAAFGDTSSQTVRGHLRFSNTVDTSSNIWITVHGWPRTAAAGKNVMLVFQSTTSKNDNGFFGSRGNYTASTTTVVAMPAKQGQEFETTWFDSLSNHGGVAGGYMDFAITRGHDPVAQGAGNDLSGFMEGTYCEVCYLERGWPITP